MEDGPTVRGRPVTTVIAAATPLIYRAAIGKFDLLRVLYGRIVIPCAVYDEVVTQGVGRPGAAETAGAAWVDRQAVSDLAKVTSLQTHLDSGESEAIVLAEELHADLVVMDESAGRRVLASRGIAFIGTVGVLMQAKQRGLIAALKPELDQLRACGFHLTDRVYRACLAVSGE
jgi:predicted nucleic acid-binding protein